MISIVSCNVCGLGPAKRQLLRSYLTDREGFGLPDFLFLQETHLDSDLAKDLTITAFGNYDVFFANRVANPTTGVCIAARRSPRLRSFSLVLTDAKDGRFLVARADITGLGLVDLMCVYAPSNVSIKERQSFFESLPWDQLGPLAILAGDWNCTLAPGEHIVTRADGSVRLNDKRPANADSAFLREALVSRDLIDPVNVLPLGDHCFSRAGKCGDQLFVQSRIDRFFISSALAPRVVNHRTGTAPFPHSDHNPVFLQLRPGSGKPGHGLWRMDPSTASLHGIGALTTQALADEGPPDGSPIDRYVAHSLLLRQLLQQIEREARARSAALLLAARDRVQAAADRLATGNRGRDLVLAWQQARDALQELEAKRACFRLNKRRQRFLRHGDKSSAAFFASVSPKSRARTTISSLNGAASSDPADLAEAGRQYYQSLFAGPSPDPDAIKKCCDAIKRKVPAAARARLAEPLSFDELVEAVSKIPASSAPGGDGVRAGLYQRFPQLLRPVLDVWNHCMEHNVPLPHALSGGIITLLHKKGDVRELDNYRPITLLTVAFKAIAGAFTARINSVLRDLVGPNQTGFIRGRDIRWNIYEVIFAHQAALRDRLSGAIIFLDMKKAYDKLSHDFLFKVLETMEFPPSFLAAVRLLVGNGVSHLMVNGFLSGVIYLRSGVPQGSPLSPALFVLATEPFRSALELAPVPGLKVAGVDLRCNMYADDGNFFIGDQASFVQFQRILRTWCAAATMEVNVSKSVAITFGRNPPDVSPYRILRPGEYERVLGARIGVGDDDNPVWAQVERKIQEKITRFSRFRQLSLFGRVLLANACILSHVWYAASFSAEADLDLAGLFKASNHFVWDPTPGFKKAMAFSQSARPVTHGGVGLLDPVLEVKAIHAHTLVAALTCPEECLWRHLLWDALLHAAPEGQRHLLLVKAWSKEELDGSLAADILCAFGSLSISGLPSWEPAPWTYNRAHGHWETRNPPIPAVKSVDMVSIAHRPTHLVSLTVKAIYRMLRADRLAKDGREFHKLSLPCDSQKDWDRRWSWLRYATLPPRARQTAFLRWHGRLYLGETKESPSAVCVHCSTPDSLFHFAKECPVAVLVRDAYLDCWALWRPRLPRSTLLHWWNDEIAPTCAFKDKDVNSDSQLQSVFMASWVILVHALYRQRIRAATDPPAVDADLTVRHRRAADSVLLAWMQELRCLLWAYASADMESTAQVKGIDSWRNSFALSEWYRSRPGGDLLNLDVCISFPLELDADDYPTPELPFEVAAPSLLV